MHATRESMRPPLNPATLTTGRSHVRRSTGSHPTAYAATAAATSGGCSATGSGLSSAQWQNSSGSSSSVCASRTRPAGAAASPAPLPMPPVAAAPAARVRALWRDHHAVSPGSVTAIQKCWYSRSARSARWMRVRWRRYSGRRRVMRYRTVRLAASMPMLRVTGAGSGLESLIAIKVACVWGGEGRFYRGLGCRLAPACDAAACLMHTQIDPASRALKKKHAMTRGRRAAHRQADRKDGAGEVVEGERG
jgi:hypothetical protein